MVEREKLSKLSDLALRNRRQGLPDFCRRWEKY